MHQGFPVDINLEIKQLLADCYLIIILDLEPVSWREFFIAIIDIISMSFPDSDHGQHAPQPAELSVSHPNNCIIFLGYGHPYVIHAANLAQVASKVDIRNVDWLQ
jgi:hypothetical protein